MAEDEFQKRYIRIFGQPSLRPAMTPENDAADPFADIFTVDLLSTPAGQLGYIRIKQFYWSTPGLEVGAVVEAFRAAVERNLASARALVIDVRGNPGGLITFAEKIQQFFAPAGVEPVTVRMLANDLNRSIFLQANAGAENRWSKAAEEAIAAGQMYTTPMALTPTSEANDMGQIWFRPIVVLTDAGCYSACDLFAAGMQDNEAAVILGTHSTTGAGGANVMEYSTFQAIMEGAALNPFQKLPHSQKMRISWRQLVRSGAQKGSLIEGVGVKSDVMIPLSSEDVQTESRQLMKQIHEAVANLEPRYTASIQSPPRGLIHLENDTIGKWTEKVVGVDRIVVSKRGEVFADKSITPSSTVTEIPIEVPQLTAAWRDRLVTVHGWLEGRQVFRVVRTLAWRGEYIPVKEKQVYDFESGDATPFHTYTLRGEEKGGWQVEDGKLRVGSGATYDSNIHARALLPLRLEEKGAKISLKVSLKSEDLYDSFRIFAINPDTGAYVLYFAGSNISEQIATFNLPKGWDRADVIFEFESDENWNLKGPRLDDLTIEPAS